MRANEHYLGDGLYASFDGYMIMLRAPREDGDHYVCLKPEVVAEFTRWLRAVHKRMAGASDNGNG